MPIIYAREFVIAGCDSVDKPPLSSCVSTSLSPIPSRRIGGGGQLASYKHLLWGDGDRQREISQYQWTLKFIKMLRI